MPLSDLPNELLVRVFDFIDWPSLKQIRLLSTNFLELIPKDKLLKYHATQSRILHEQELLLLKQITQFYWEEAEESFLGYHSSSYTSSSLDPDLRAQEEKHTCIHHQLPCYHCLSWKSSLTDSPAFEMLSAFSRRMSTGSRNLGSKHASTRICITCGIRSGLYTKGVMLKHSVRCHSCGNFTEPMQARDWGDRDRLDTLDWQPKWLCSSCCVSSRYSKLTREQFMHELRWEKYETSMAASRLYRLEKGNQLRKDKGIYNFDGNVSIEHYKKPRYCPVMQEARFCHCSIKKLLRLRRSAPILSRVVEPI